MKWLPHALSTQQSDAVGPMRMVTTSLDDLAALLPPDLSDRPRFGRRAAGQRHILLVSRRRHLPPGNHVVLPTACTASRCRPAGVGRARRRVRLDAARVRRAGRGGALPAEALGCARRRYALADQCDLATAEAFARRLTPLHTVTAGVTDTPSGEIAGPTDFMDLLGLGDVHGFDPAPPGAAARPRPAARADRARRRGGVSSPRHQGVRPAGHGPHGLVIGATGSGKSEFLRTLVLGLAMTHSPEQLNMVLVDFKGGATFAGMSEMPHVSAVITNLAQELTLVDRMQDALSGEMVRRRAAPRGRQLRLDPRLREGPRAGEDARAAAVAVHRGRRVLRDALGQAGVHRPVRRDRPLGRSLGLHLLLASQRLEEAGCAASSPTCPTASACAPSAPPSPAACSACPTPTSCRPSPAWASSSPTSRRCCGSRRRTSPGRRRARRAYAATRAGAARHPAVHDLRGADARAAADGRGRRARRRSPAGRASLLDIAVDRMEATVRAHQVWLPLDVPDTLDELMPDLVEDPDLGLVSPEWRRLGGLVMPLGTVDRRASSAATR